MSGIPFGEPRARRRLLCAVLLAAGAASSVHAAPAEELAELPIEALLNLEVFSASRFAQKRSEALSAVSVVTAADIKAFGWRTLADILGSMRGLYLGYDRNYAYLGARGFLRPGDYNTRFLLLIDGNRANDSVFDQAAIGTDFALDVDLIERVEFVHGPGSSIYGANALFGVINVITKSGRDLDGVQAQVEAGSSGTRSGRVSYGWRSDGGAELLMSATAYRQGGEDLYFPEFDAPSTNNGVAVGLDHDRADKLFVKGSAGPFSVSLAHSQRTKGIPTASFAQLFNDPRAHTVDEQTLVDFGYRAELAPDVQLFSRLYWGRFDYEGDYIYDYPPVTINRDVTRARWWGAEARMTNTSVAGHKLVFGTEYQRDYRRDQANFDVVPFQSYLDSRRSSERWGVYLQDEVSLGDDVLLTAGLRYDRTVTGAGAFNPRIGLVYRASPATTFKAVYATAFRAPNAYEQFYDLRTAGGQKSNPALGPERVRSAELAVEHHLSSNTRLSASVFRNTVEDLISQTLDPNDGLLMFENLDRVHAHGVSVELEHQGNAGARLRTSASLQRATDAISGAKLVNSPGRMAKFNYSLPVLEGRWRTGIEAQYVGPRRTLARTIGGYWLANLTLSGIRLGPGLEAGISVYNLFDRRYAYPGSAEHVQDVIMQDGRSVLLRLEAEF